MKRYLTLIGMITALGLLMVVPMSASEGELIWDTLILEEEGIAVGEYTERPNRNNRIRQELLISVQQASPNKNFRVTLKGRRIGSLRTDETGSGVLHIVRNDVRPEIGGRPARSRRIDSGDILMISSASRFAFGVFDRSN